MKFSNLTIRLLAVTMIICASVKSASSQSAKEIFRHGGDNIIWMGVDFTQANLIGDLGTVGRDELIPLFDDINRVIITEKTKYSFEKAFRKDVVPYDLVAVTKLNGSIDPAKLVPYSSARQDSKLNEESISVLVKEYRSELEEGIGLVFFIESLDKYSEKANMWVAFFTLPDRNLIFTERMWGAAGGITFRNHWSRPVFEVIEKIRATKYADWKYRFSR